MRAAGFALLGLILLSPYVLGGAMPRVVEGMAPAPAAGNAAPAIAAHMVWGGGPVLHAPKVYLVFWGWGSAANPLPADPAGEAPVLAAFFAGIGGSSWLESQTQYTDAAGHVGNQANQLGGVWWDNRTEPLTIPDEWIATEANYAASHFGYPQDAVYFIALPHLHNNAEFGPGGYCAYHSATTAGTRTIAYVDFPYIPDSDNFLVSSCGDNFVNSGAAGNLDGVTIVAGHEYAEAVTDPVPNTGWNDPSNGETGDICAWISSGQGAMQDITLSTGKFAVQSLWSNSANACVQSG
ncbi:MAG: hypothetical protein QOE90_2867 [Thermoplasmata archaeon]|jgi:serine protease|nr:hypothetical protein [Thermoplasmata archaeon]